MNSGEIYMNNNTHSIKISELEADEMIAKGRLKKIHGLTPEERAILYGERIAQESIDDKLYKTLQGVIDGQKENEKNKHEECQ